jgi:hypothetical protein
MTRLFSILLLLTITSVAEARLWVSPTWINFGTVYVDDWRSQTIWIQNQGPEIADVQVSDSSCMFDFNVNKYGCWRRLNPNESCQIQIDFRPRNVGYRSCTLYIDDRNGVSTWVNISGDAINRR